MGNTRHTRYRRKTNKTKIQQREILVTLDTQDIGGRQKNKNTTKRDTGNTRRTRDRRKTNKTKIQQREILVTLYSNQVLSLAFRLLTNY
jgi:ribosome-binding protein aMBF1 (putative translation factor)